MQPDGGGEGGARKEGKERPETRAAPRPLLAGEGLALRSAAGGLALAASGAPLAEGPGGRPEYAPPCLHNVALAALPRARFPRYR